jgi:general secretion pathway protein I
VTPSTAEEGFSLVEALVALVILGVAAAGLVRAVEAHVDSIRGVERRAAAQFVAENALVELRLSTAPAPSEVDMLGERWRVSARETANEDPDIRNVEVRVEPTRGAGPVVALRGFLDARRSTS